MSLATEDEAFDRAFVASALHLAGRRGWLKLSLADAARSAGLSLPRARARFPTRFEVLQRLGRLLDGAAIADISVKGSVRDALFDSLMSRFDGLQAHRDGVLALLNALPFDPMSAAVLGRGTTQSMRWMLDAVAVDTTGLMGELKVQALVGVWLWGVRAWRADASPDLSATMAAVDTALRRVTEFTGWTDESAESMQGTSESIQSGANETGPPPAPDASQPV